MVEVFVSLVLWCACAPPFFLVVVLRYRSVCVGVVYSLWWWCCGIPLLVAVLSYTLFGGGVAVKVVLLCSLLVMVWNSYLFCCRSCDIFLMCWCCGFLYFSTAFCSIDVMFFSNFSVMLIFRCNVFCFPLVTLGNSLTKEK